MDLEWGVILTQLGGGLALFLYGMHRMMGAPRTVAGSGMKDLLAKLTTNRFTAAAAGAMITAVIQSSSVTMVLTVGFISAGLLSFSQSVGVILGANVGGLHFATRRAGAETPRAPDPVPRRVRTGEPRPGADRARDTHRRFRSTW